MLYFLGNCQAEFLARSLADRGHACAYRVQASPFTYPSHPGSVPGSLAALERESGLADYLDGRELKNQFAPIGPEDPAPELIVMNLHHENEPLFTHKTEGYTFHMNVRGLNDRPELMAWAREYCNMFLPNPATYLKRFGLWLARVRADFPGVPVLVLTRLRPHLGFGPDPFSYLRGWDGLHQEAPAVLAQWTAAGPGGVHVLDMDRVFGGLWARDPAPRIEALCPFLKIELTEKDGEVTGLHARRDIEHAGPLPDRLADKVEDFLRTGAITYTKDEAERPEWRRPPRLALPDDDALRAGLASGSNYRAAWAVGCFFLDLGRDRTPLLREAAGAMPVCHNTLHMVRAYGRLRPTPDLAAWCDVHRAAAEGFTANGPLYRTTYLERLDEIRDFVTG